MILKNTFYVLVQLQAHKKDLIPVTGVDVDVTRYFHPCNSQQYEEHLILWSCLLQCSQLNSISSHHSSTNTET